MVQFMHQAHVKCTYLLQTDAFEGETHKKWEISTKKEEE